MKLLVASLFCWISVVSAQQKLPGNSIYQIGGDWQNQNAEVMGITDLRGKKQVLSMVYTNCQHVCPMIVSSMKSVERSLLESERKNIGFVLVSFTPDIDTHEVLKDYAKKHSLDLDRWTLLRTENGKEREMAMMLGVKYRVLENNEVNHSNLISVLDEHGGLLFQESGDPGHAKSIAQRINSWPEE